MRIAGSATMNQPGVMYPSIIQKPDFPSQENIQNRHVPLATLPEHREELLLRSLQIFRQIALPVIMITIRASLIKTWGKTAPIVM
jgi:hypothetical protein